MEKLTFFQLAEIVSANWRETGYKNFLAQNALDFLSCIQCVEESFGILGSARNGIERFLSHARGWRGPVARTVKKELRRRLRR